MIEWASRLDAVTLQTLYAHRTIANTDAAIAVTELGSTWTLVGITAIVLLLLVLYRKFRAALIVALATSLTGLSVGLLKHLIARPRPDKFYAAYHEIDYAFPSGHAAGSCIVYGLCAYLLAQAYPRARIYIYAVAATLILAISVSRLWLGVHYATDVIAGLALGGLFIILATKAASLE